MVEGRGAKERRSAVTQGRSASAITSAIEGGKADKRQGEGWGGDQTLREGLASAVAIPQHRKWGF